MKKTNIEALTSGSILYYPTIEFQSDAWLKAAICVWEKVYRIVPPSYKPSDSDEVADANKSKRSEWKKSDAFYHLALHNNFGWAEGRRAGLPRISDRFHEFMDD